MHSSLTTDLKTNKPFDLSWTFKYDIFGYWTLLFSKNLIQIFKHFSISLYKALCQKDVNIP